MKNDGNQLSDEEKVQKLYDVEVVKILRKHKIKDFSKIEVTSTTVSRVGEVYCINFHINYKGKLLGDVEISNEKIKAIIF